MINDTSLKRGGTKSCGCAKSQAISQWLTDDLNWACDDLTNHNAVAIPLFD